jgi:hypothetical protein
MFAYLTGFACLSIQLGVGTIMVPGTLVLTGISDAGAVLALLLMLVTA